VDEMSEEPKGDSGITTRDDIKSHTAYTDTIPTKKPKTKVERQVNRSREVKM